METGVVKNRTYPYVGKTNSCDSDIPKLGQVPSLNHVTQYNLNGNETLLKNILAAEGDIKLNGERVK